MKRPDKWAQAAKEKRDHLDQRQSNKERGIPNPPYSKTNNAALANANGEHKATGGNNNKNNRFTPSNMVPRNVPTKKVQPIPIEQFSLRNDTIKELQKGKISRVVLSNVKTNGVVTVVFEGGGTIPATIGVGMNENGTHVTVTFDSESDRRKLDEIANDMLSEALANFSSWYPPEKQHVEISKTIVKPLGEAVMKKDKSGMWPQNMSMNADPYDLFPKDSRQEPDLVILNEDGTRVTNLNYLLGQKWTSLVVWFKSIFLGYDATTNEPRISLTKVLRFMTIAVDMTAHHLVFPHEVDTVDCKRPHHIPIPASEFSFEKHVDIWEVVPKDKSLIATMNNKAGGDVIIELTGGGTLPVAFYLSQNREGKTVVTVSVGTQDQLYLERITEEFKQITVKRRAQYYPRSKDEDSQLPRYVKSLLNPVSEENPDAANYSRNIGIITETEKLKSTVFFLNADNTIIENPGELEGKRWSKIWISFYCSYVKKLQNNMFEVGISKRLRLLQLADNINNFSIDYVPQVQKKQKLSGGDNAASTNVDH